MFFLYFRAIRQMRTMKKYLIIQYIRMVGHYHRHYKIELQWMIVPLDMWISIIAIAGVPWMMMNRRLHQNDEKLFFIFKLFIVNVRMNWYIFFYLDIWWSSIIYQDNFANTIQTISDENLNRFRILSMIYIFYFIAFVFLWFLNRK